MKLKLVDLLYESLLTEIGEGTAPLPLTHLTTQATGYTKYSFDIEDPDTGEVKNTLLVSLNMIVPADISSFNTLTDAYLPRPYRNWLYEYPSDICSVDYLDTALNRGYIAEVSFTMKGFMFDELSGLGKPFQIISTVKWAVLDFLQRNPDCEILVFESTGKNNGDLRRERLYMAYVNNAIQSIESKFVATISTGYYTFLLSSKALNHVKEFSACVQESVEVEDEE